jgi:starvation-inducible DNA-binding protein
VRRPNETRALGSIAGRDVLEELRNDNESLVAGMRETHALCDEKGDLAGASRLENWIDEGERRVWFLFETTRQGI